MKLTDLIALVSKGFLVIVLIGSVINSVHAQDKIDIKVGYKKGQQYRVESQYQHTGSVVVNNAGQDKDAKALPMETNARLNFFERFVGSASNPQVVRYYDASNAKIEIDKGKAESKLAKNNQLIVTRIKAGTTPPVQIASILDVLNQTELELLKNPADPLSFAALINKSNVKVGDQWQPEREAVANFLGVDRVIKSDIQLKLKEADSESAKIYLMGHVVADIDDVSTDMNIHAVLVVDLKDRFVTSVRLNITENREPGQVAPGFNGKSKIDLEVSTTESCKELSREYLAKHLGSKKILPHLKWESRVGNFELLYDPSWKLIASEQEAAILRYLENGSAMAQCNIVQLGSRPADKPLTLEEFKKEVAKIVAQDEMTRMVSSGQQTTSEGLRALKVTVYGEEKGVPLNWIYYHVAGNDGRQVTFVFTLEEEISNRVLPAAARMVDGFKFLAMPVKAKLSDTKPAARDAKKDAVKANRR